MWRRVGVDLVAEQQEQVGPLGAGSSRSATARLRRASTPWARFPSASCVPVVRQVPNARRGSRVGSSVRIRLGGMPGRGHTSAPSMLTAYSSSLPGSRPSSTTSATCVSWTEKVGALHARPARVTVTRAASAVRTQTVADVSST